MVVLPRTAQPTFFLKIITMKIVCTIAYCVHIRMLAKPYWATVIKTTVIMKMCIPRVVARLFPSIHSYYTFSRLQLLASQPHNYNLILAYDDNKKSELAIGVVIYFHRLSQYSCNSGIWRGQGAIATLLETSRNTEDFMC